MVATVVSAARALSRAQFAKMIQFTNVRPYATRDNIVAHLQVCDEYGFDGAMIANCWVPLAHKVLRGTGVKVATCIGLGFGQENLHGKVALIRECLALDADEIDYGPTWPSSSPACTTRSGRRARPSWRRRPAAP